MSESDTSSLTVTAASTSRTVLRNGGLRRHPSQVQMWYTTVPQSLSNSRKELGSRHVPTRRSLRHSRMMVLSRTGAVPRKFLPPVMERHVLGTGLALCKLLLGLVMSGLAAWVMVWAPHIAARDAAHYSGLVLCLSGWVGVLLTTCCRYHYPGTKQDGCVFPVKSYHIVVTAFLSAVSLLCCLLAFCRHSLHLYLLYFAVPNCAEYPLDRDQSPGWLLGLMDVTKERNDQFTCHCSVPPQCAALVAALSLHDDALSYVGLSCVEVKRVLPAIITVAAVLNFVGLFLSAWFAGLVTCSRNNRRFREWRTSRSGGKFAAASLEKKSKTVAAKGVSADTEAVRPMIGNGAA